MKTESEFLGKPVEYWLEIEKEVNSCVIDSDFFKRIVIENYRLKCENNKLTERIKDLVSEERKEL